MIINNTDDPIEIFYKLLDIHKRLKASHYISYFRQRNIPDVRVRTVVWKELSLGNLELTKDRFVQRRIK